MKKDPPRQEHEITQLLAEWSDGNQAALDELYPLVYEELHVGEVNKMLRKPGEITQFEA